MVRVTGTASKRVTPAALTATKPWGRARLIYHMHADRGHGKGRREGFTETDYAHLLDAAHRQPGSSLVVVWDNRKCATRRCGIEWG